MKSLEAKQSKNPFKAVFLTLFALSAVCLGFSYYFQFWAKLTPCKLCLLQRYSYLILAITSGLGMRFGNSRLILRTGAIILSLGLFVAAYQSLGDLKLIETKCNTGVSQVFGLLTDKSRSEITSNCSEKILKLCGISLSTLNATVFLVGLIITFTKAKKCEKEIGKTSIEFDKL